jgi:hypothetical protein
VKRLAVLTITAALALTGMAQTKPPVHAKGHRTKEGTTVAPHDRTAPDNTRQNNWSTKGNTNPEIGKKGGKSAVKPPAKR